MQHTPLSRLKGAVAIALRPPPVLTYSKWAAENFRLPPESSAQPGKFRPWKFQRGILDAIGDPTIERVTVKKAARTGFTKSLVAAIGAIAVNDPSPIILLMPTDDDARGIAVDEIDPAFRDSPVLRGVLKQGRLDGRNTLLHRTLVGGGTLKILSARAPRNLRRHTAKVLFCDEVDGMEITNEGDPIKLAEMRTMSFADRKIVLGSTPTDEALSIVNARYEESDKRIFKMPCPHCGHRFELLWEHIKWPDGRPREAYAICPEAGCIIEEREKPAMMEAGDWEAQAPDVIGHAGFQLSALISLFANASWGKLAEEYVKARKAGPSAMQVFTNTVLGRVWSTAVGYVDENELMTRVEDFCLTLDNGRGAWIEKIPAQVLYITVGVDVQPDRLEVTLLGWSADGERWVLGHEVIRGSIILESTWQELDALLGTTWLHPLGGRIGIEAACIDSGDGNTTQHVYDFCSSRAARRIVPIKGKSGPIPTIKASQQNSRKKQRGVTLWIVGVDQVKTDLLTALHFEPGQAGRLRFSNTLDPEWFVQFTSERRELKYSKGRPVYEFVRIQRRAAEALDATVYAVAARGLCRFDYARREADLAKKPVTRSLKDIAAKLNR